MHFRTTQKEIGYTLCQDIFKQSRPAVDYFFFIHNSVVVKIVFCLVFQLVVINFRFIQFCSGKDY